MELDYVKILTAIMAENHMTTTPIVVTDDYTTIFPDNERRYGCVATVHVIINNQDVNHAVYGIRPDSTVSCWMS